MQLPSGQLLLPFFAQRKAQMPPGRALFLRHLLEGLMREEQAEHYAPGFFTKPRFHGTRSQALKTIGELDPAHERNNSELQAAYTASHKKLASKFGDNIIQGYPLRERLANLDKPVSPGMIRLMSAQMKIPEGDLWEVLRQSHRTADYKIHGRKALTRGRVRGQEGFEPDDKEYHPDISPTVKGEFYKVGKPTLGTFLKVLQSKIPQEKFTNDPNLNDVQMNDLMGQKYGNPKDAVRILRSLGFRGSSDIDWFYSYKGKNVSRSNRAHLPEKWIKEHHLYQPGAAAPDRKSAEVLEGVAPGLTRLARALGATGDPANAEKRAYELIADMKARLEHARKTKYRKVPGTHNQNPSHDPHQMEFTSKVQDPTEGSWYDEGWARGQPPTIPNMADQFQEHDIDWDGSESPNTVDHDELIDASKSLDEFSDAAMSQPKAITAHNSSLHDHPDAGKDPNQDAKIVKFINALKKAKGKKPWQLAKGPGHMWFMWNGKDWEQDIPF